MNLLQEIAENLGATGLTGGSWMQTIAIQEGATGPVGDSWIQAWSDAVGFTGPTGGSWIQSIADYYGVTASGGDWLRKIKEGTTFASYTWDYISGIGDCNVAGGNQFYTSTEFPLPGDIVYSDNTLTTPFVGDGPNNYYAWGIGSEGGARGSWEINTDGTILSNFFGLCVGIITASSGSLEADCEAVINETIYSVLNPIVGSRFFILDGNDNVIGYFNGQNKYYRYFNGVFSIIWRINNEGLVTEEIICP